MILAILVASETYILFFICDYLTIVFGASVSLTTNLGIGLQEPNAV